jgi:hypothetical protein
MDRRLGDRAEQQLQELASMDADAVVAELAVELRDVHFGQQPPGRSSCLHDLEGRSAAGDAIRQAEAVEELRCVRPHREAGTDLGQLIGLFEYVRFDPRARERDRRRESADSAADYKRSLCSHPRRS